MKTISKNKPSKAHNPDVISGHERLRFEDLWRDQLQGVAVKWLAHRAPVELICQHVAWHLFKMMRNGRN